MERSLGKLHLGRGEVKTRDKTERWEEGASVRGTGQLVWIPGERSLEATLWSVSLRGSIAISPALSNPTAGIFGWKCWDPMVCERNLSSLSTREEAWTERARPARPTGSGGIWQDPSPGRYTLVPTLGWLTWGTCSHPRFKHQGGPGPHDPWHPASSGHKEASPSGSWLLSPAAWTSGWQITALKEFRGGF